MNGRGSQYALELLIEQANQLVWKYRAVPDQNVRWKADSHGVLLSPDDFADSAPLVLLTTNPSM